MAEEKIEYVERDYNHCVRKEKPRLIKARVLSFNSIANRFKNFRLNLMKKRLDSMKDKALTEKYSESNFSKKIDKKSKAIAKLEEKIMVISKEEVPTDYVSKRAIKLKKSMIDNLSYNSHLFYSIGLENKDKIFEKSVENESIDSSVMVDGLHEVVDGETEVSSEDLTKQTIADIVNAELDSVSEKDKDQEEQIEEYGDIPKSIDGDVAGGLEDIVVNESSNDGQVSEMSKEEIQRIIDDAFTQTEVSAVSENDKKEEPAPGDSVHEEVEDAINMIKVSRNNSGIVRAEKFDEQGEEKTKKGKYQYTPMSDEEIRESQRKLGFDENGNILDSEVATTSGDSDIDLSDVVVEKNESLNDRVVPIIAADRSDQADSNILEDDEDNNMFEIVDNVDKEENTEQGDKGISEFSFVDEPEAQEEDDGKSSVASRLEDYLSLKEKIMHLQEQRRISEEKRKAAEKTAEETSERAQQAQMLFEESQKTYEEKINLLKAYTESLEAECLENEKGAEIAESDAQKSESFIATQHEKADENYRVIEEIDGIINGGSSTASTDSDENEEHKSK